MSASTPALVNREIIVEPPHGWSSLNLRELWEFRDLLYFLVWRDLKGRYQQMALGPLWILIQPLMSMVLYTLLFGVIAGLPSDGKPYAIFAYTALLPWGFFSDAVASGANCFVENRAIMAKIYFPRLLLPLARMISGLVDLGISFLILIVMLIGYGIQPNAGVLLLPALLAIAGLAGLAVGLWFSGIVARFRDFGQVAGYLVRAWMYATPVVYSMAQVPDQWRALYQLNPLVGVVEGFRWALLNTTTPPDWGILAAGTVVIIIVFIGGLYYFRRTERSIVDIA